MSGDLLFGAIADDLTGGVELAAMLRAGGVRALLVTDSEAAEAAENTDAIVIALRTRVVAPAQAVEAFAMAGRALRRRGARQIFYKYCATFDSTPAGNIGPCTDVLQEITGAPATLFCPSYPYVDRTVYRGHMFVGDQLLSDLPKRFDPLTPMTEPDLVKVLQAQTARRVGLIGHPTVLKGAEAIRAASAALCAQGIGYGIVDTITENDLAVIAEASWDWPLMTGGASVAWYYPALWQRHGLAWQRGTEALPRVSGPGVAIAGSCAVQTQAQMAAFGADHPVLRIDLLASGDVDLAVDQAMVWTRLQGRGPLGFTTAADPAAIEAAQAGLGREGAARRAEAVLGALASRLVDYGVRRLVVAGGETSGAVVGALKIRRCEVAGFESPGIGLCVSKGDPSLALCLKSGKLGSRTLFADALAMMGED